MLEFQLNQYFDQQTISQILPIVTVEPITSVITCKVYVRTSFGCNSDKLKFPPVAFLYNTGDEGSMIEQPVIRNSSSSTTQSAVV